MSLASRETNIIWLNWKEMFYEAEERQDENFFQLSAILAHRIESLCGTENLIEWKGEYLCEDRGFDPTVMFHVRNIGWDWSSPEQSTHTRLCAFRRSLQIRSNQLSAFIQMTQGNDPTVLYNQRDYQHIDTHTQKVIRNLNEGAGCYGGIDVNLFKYQWQQGTP